jgi:hypothetical protein
VLIGNYIILILWVYGLVVRWDIDIVIGQFVFAEVLEEISYTGQGEVDVGVI